MSDDFKVSLGGLAGGASALPELKLRQSRVEQTLGQERGSKVRAPGEKRSEAEIDKAATDFEALLLNTMLQSMWNTVPQSGMLSGTREESLYRDMLNEQLAESMATHQSLGIKEMIARDMRKTEKK